MAGKKYKVFKICKELNLGHETIISFLEQKGEKVSGPNASVSEDLYLEILERFATDKAKAEQIKARRAQKEGKVEEPEAQEAKTVEESSYLQELKKSIEAGVEAIARGKEEKPAKAKKTSKAKKEEAQPKPVEAEAAAQPEAAREETPVAAKPEPETAKEQAVVTPVEEKIEKEAPVAEKPKVQKEKEEKPAAKAKEKEEEKKAKAKTKKKGKKGKSSDEAGISEKERKRRKAMEMIRKEKKLRRGPRLAEIAVGGEDLVEQPKKKKSKRQKRKKVDLKEVQDTLKKTLASMESKGKKSKKHKKIIKTEDGQEIEENILKVAEFISVNELANLLDVPVAEIITKCLELGLVVTINQRLDIDTISLLAEEYGYKVEEQFVSEFIDDEEEEEVDESQLVPRAPIVTIMGHVDHGKTSLLDYLRKSNIAGGEAGGITQHIGAYEVEYDGKLITFLDTPGHEAFTAMRARGAQVTDIVVLIIAADDAVMPQTDEALDHAKAAGAKIVIAINKIDKPGADPERIKQQLAERDVLVEEWGGTYQVAEISAKTGQGIPDLLEKILLEAEMLDLKANPNRRAKGVIIESRLDRGKGAIATVLVQDGTLRVGDNFVAGHYYGKVRALLNEREERIKEVKPSQPAVVVGFEGVPQAGDIFMVMKDERSARELSSKRMQLKREQDAKQVKLMTLAQISEQIKHGETQELPIVIKADSDGSAEALADAFTKLSTDEVKVNIIRKGVGAISESDVLLASASRAVIIGFHVIAHAKARELANTEKVDIRLYRVIYDATNDIKMAMEGMLAPEIQEKVVGQAEVRETFKISRIGTVAGCYVTEGKIFRNNKVRLIRDGVEVYFGNISSLKRFKDDVKEVASGFECGIQIENYNDIKVGDIIQSLEEKEVKRTL
ncbi:MAG TPA: translation initiation factor IF-2 [Caldithrix abyssi]|uniref:Translation initiation factor IF-2 n=1 Tax=Caldithrix abyssi TaxID=187145 RepID=A0A7V5PR63_CALAY|nr:translation initiation factor IF-2 [Caldithrix abyssi]